MIAIGKPIVFLFALKGKKMTKAKLPLHIYKIIENSDLDEKKKTKLLEFGALLYWLAEKNINNKVKGK
ncbi:hypothetical protein [Mycoplasma crocodyli]|uniref:hypothetical protein n=1 Tax=Mycoplasma crocodyli TaxID=50052 RepID=UPI0011D097A8|nr:hypothetical protein [Mycoplasma crocodyli]